jgi:multidrug efflux pump subunit AcrA (membrane-fusion protein)
MNKGTKSVIITLLLVFPGALLFTTGCAKTEAKPPAAQPLPVKVETVDLSPVPRTDEYVATIKSRRSASIQPQVDGTLTKILVK